MNTKRLTLSFVAVFVFVFLYDFAVHGQLLTELYEQTSNLWRPKGEHKMEFIFASQVLFSAMIAYIFTRNHENKGIRESVRFGLMIGLLIGATQIGTYCYMPIPLALTLSWTVAEIVKGLGAGIVLALVYKE